MGSGHARRVGSGKGAANMGLPARGIGMQPVSDQGGERPPPGQTPAVALASCDAETLSQFGSPYLLAEGKVCVISLAAIAQRLGPRWPLRRDIVREHTVKLLDRTLGTDALHSWASETSIIVAQPTSPDIIGQARCLNCLKEILQHFLGDSNIEDTIVHSVTRIVDGDLLGERLDVRRVTAAALQLSARSEGARPSTNQWSPFVTSAGRRVRVSCLLEPLIQLKSSRRIGYRISRRVLETPSEIELPPQDLERLSRADHASIDAASITRGLERLRAETSDAKALSLIVPVTFSTLSHPAGAATLVDLLAQARADVQHGIICEIVDYARAPPAALAAALATIRPHCSHVVGRWEAGRAFAASPERAGDLVSGVCFECPAMAGDAEFVGWVRTLLAGKRPAGAGVLLFQLSDPRQVALATALGASHASLKSRT